jgi:hypothetical protein
MSLVCHLLNDSGMVPDETAVNPGQQLWLHTAYDDGWTLCEDQNQNRGVVPLTCIEPWTEDSNLPR